MSEEVVLKLFDKPKLNEIGLELIELDEQYSQHLEDAKESLYSAFKTRWLYGKIISENVDIIEEECGTQKAFAKTIGKSPGVVSNNKRGYENLRDEGCEEWDDVIELLKFKSIKPTVRNFEKIGTLLNEPSGEEETKDRIDKDRKRLEEIRGEAEEILRRLEPGEKPAVLEDAFEFVEDIEDIQEYVESFYPEKTGWRSEKYLNFLRNFGFDVITGDSCDKCDPHHVSPSGGSGPTGDKLPDYYAIPVSRDTHTKLESGEWQASEEVILKAQFRALTAFLTLNM